MQHDSSFAQPDAPDSATQTQGDPRHGPGADVDRAHKRLNLTQQPSSPIGRHWLVFVIFTLSGAAGLIYEVVWSRQLVLVFGNTTQAVSAILTGFFGGMAIGSLLGGRLADRARRPLRLYGLLELLLVVVVLLTPLTFLLIHDVYRGAFSALIASPHLLALVRFGLALLALGPATILMGATLPTLTRYLSRTAADLSSAFGKLYAVNTIGAILGTITAGFVLIELLGLSGALRVGAACSAIAGSIALLLDYTADPAPAQAERSAAPLPDNRAQGSAAAVPHRRIRLALLVAFVSGLTSLGYQVLWTRLLASGTGNSTYVFTTILAVFLIGLALGAVAFALFRTRIQAHNQTIDLLAIGQVVIALLVLLGMVTVISHGSSVVIGHGLSTVRALFVSGLIVVLPATFIMGLTFPASSALITGPEGHVGANSGLLLSANTLGSITGTFLIPFVVIPLVGSPVALGLIALVNLATGIALALAGRIEAPSLRWLTAGAGAITAVVLLVALTLGNVFVDPNIVRLRADNGTLAMSLEDEIASVQAGTDHDRQQLWVTGTSMTVLTVDTKLMPILPLALRPDSRSELTIAFGMGSAYRASLNAGLTTTAVELVPSVPKTFGVFYPDAQQVLANPHGHIVIADGRNYVELTDQHYDIIVVDPPPPIYSSGVSVISSREFYAAAKARLTPGGVMMQWVPYGSTLDELKAHLRTYRDVFPHVIIAFGPGGSGIYMLGSEQPIAFDQTAIHQALSRSHVVDDISSAFDSPRHDLEGWATAIPTLVWIQGDQVARFAGTGPLVTDDHPLPEYFLLRSRYGPPSPTVTHALLKSLTPAP
ncbi:MAG TPA: fused MFS/spermidine synthase [Ktedonobacterales bacterium]